MFDSKFITNSKPETTGARQASERAEKEPRRRGPRRSLRRFERGSDGLSPGWPAGESNPIAWLKPEARHRSRGPAFRCVCILTHIISSSKEDKRLPWLSRARAPNTQTQGVQELATAVILVPVLSCSSMNSRIQKHLSMPCCAMLLLMGNSGHLVIR